MLKRWWASLQNGCKYKSFHLQIALSQNWVSVYSCVCFWWERVQVFCWDPSKIKPASISGEDLWTKRNPVVYSAVISHSSHETLAMAPDVHLDNLWCTNKSNEITRAGKGLFAALPLDFSGKLPAVLFCFLQPVAGEGNEISDWVCEPGGERVVTDIKGPSVFTLRDGLCRKQLICFLRGIPTHPHARTHTHTLTVEDFIPSILWS